MSVAPIDVVLSRIPGARQSPRGWKAPCPSHADRDPSLSISIGRDGAVLLRCFAGCTAAQIVGAIGMNLRDLFSSSDILERERADRLRQRTAYRRAPRATVTAYLSREIERQRALRLARCSHDAPYVRSADVNAARRRANATFGLQLEPIASYPFEGYSPHDADPDWPMLFTRALDEVSWCLQAFKYPDAPIWEATPLPTTLHPLAADLAADWLHEIARSPASVHERVA